MCKSEEQIKTWLARKFIFITLNNIRFSTREFSSDQKVMNEANVLWIPVSSQIREEAVYKVQLTDLELQDTYY